MCIRDRVGALAGGFISLGALGSNSTTGKYGSLVVAVVVAAVVAGIAAVISNLSSVSGRN